MSTLYAFSRARNLMMSNKIGSHNILVAALFQAQADGYRDFHDGIFTMPDTFTDIKDLASYWQHGQDIAQADHSFGKRMNNCLYCTNTTDEPCPWHSKKKEQKNEKILTKIPV